MLNFAVVALALHVQPPGALRRRELCAGTAALFASALTGSAPAFAYDSPPNAGADLVALEKARAVRQARVAKNRAGLKPYLDNLSAAKDLPSFVQAADQLALWVIGEGSLPEGLDARDIRDAINAAYGALPVKSYACTPTRTNGGVCYTPGAEAEDAYKLCLRELRKYSTAKGKGALQSDGVSAANSAAF